MAKTNKRIDFIVSEYSNLSAPEFVRVVTDSFYNNCAKEYDSTHPDIFYDAALALHRILDVLKAKISHLDEYTIIDIGCGTGFVASELLKDALPFERYIGFEPSKEMRSIASKKFKDTRLNFQPLDILKNSVMFDIINQIKTKKIIILNSTLHHIVWWEDFLKDIKNSLYGGDMLVLCHEPNLRFWQNKVLVDFFDMIVKEKNNKERVFIYLNPLNYVRKIQKILKLNRCYSLPAMADLINKELTTVSAIKKALPAITINAIIDYGVPLCWRGIDIKEGYDERFYSAEDLTKEYFYDMKVILSFTYQHLGFSPKILSKKWEKKEKLLEKEYPLDGAQFCLVLKKLT